MVALRRSDAVLASPVQRLAFGVLFATITTLFSVPALDVITDDLRRGGRWLLGRPPDDTPIDPTA